MRAMVSCVVAAGDAPMAISWLRDGQPLGQPLRGSHLNPGVEGLQVVPHGSFTSSLVLDRAALEHAGNYTCVARNEAREAAHTAALLVRGRTRQLLSKPAVLHRGSSGTAKHLHSQLAPNHLFSTKDILSEDDFTSALLRSYIS